MKKFSYSLCALIGAFFCTVFATQAQTFNYTINAGNSPNPLVRITNVLTTIPAGSGVINNGDAVGMQLVYPNSSSNTGYKFNVVGLPGTATSFQWSVSGDLTTVGPVTGTNVIIKHLDILDRGTNTMDSAQSKGRIAFSYGSTIPGCGGRTTISFDVYKVFNGTNNSAGTITGMTVVPAITGPNCIQPNKQYTYSVDPIVSDNLNSQIGIDRYFWDISATGGTIDYYSTDTSSITFTTGASVPSNCTISCGMGMANYPPLQTNPTRQAYATKALQASAGTPVVNLSGPVSGVITAGVPFCVPTNGSSVTPLTFTVTPQPGATYSWTFGTVGAFGTGSVNDWNTSPAQTGPIPYSTTGNSLTIANIFNQPGVVTLTVTDVCGTITNYHYQIGRTLTAADASLITIANTCLAPGGSTTVSIPSAPAANEANLNTLVWTPVANWTFPSGSINPGATVTPGVYTLNAGFAGCLSSVPYTINVKPATVSITSPSPLCFPPGSTGNSVTASPAAASGYSWTSTAGTITGTSSTASLITTTTSPFTIAATYTVAPGCFTTGSASSDLSPIAPTVSIPSCIGGAPIALPVTNYPGYGTYTLTFMSGTNIVASSSFASGTITAVMNGATGSGQYKVTHSNGACGTASSTITLATSTAPYTVSILFNNSPSYVIIGANTGAYTYTWYNCTTNTPLGVTTNPPTAAIQLSTYTPGSMDAFGAEATIGGCTYRVCTTVPDFQYRQHGGGITGAPDMPASVGSIYPNPNNGVFTIELEHVTKEASALIYDINGKIIHSTKLNTGATRISEVNMAPGQYIVVLLVDGNYYVHKMTITK